MSKFKVGDKVRIISDIDVSTYKNQEGKILEISGSGWHLVDVPTKIHPDTVWWESELELVSDKVPHKHVEMIKAWADGEQIQYKLMIDGEWEDVKYPLWDKDYEYRIKPEPKPDVVKFAFIEIGYKNRILFAEDQGNDSNCKFNFDGETNQLKSVEMIEEKS